MPYILRRSPPKWGRGVPFYPSDRLLAVVPPGLEAARELGTRVDVRPDHPALLRPALFFATD